MPAAADAVPGLLPHRPVALEGMDARLVDVVRARRGAGRRPGPAARRRPGCSSRPRATPRPRRRAAAERLINDAGASTPLVVTGGPARALWRIREDGAGPGRPHPGGRAGLARLGGRRRPARSTWAPTCGTSPRCWASTTWTACSTATSATAACTSASTSRWPTAPGRYREFVVAAAQLVAASTAARCPASTATAGPAASCCRYMYSPEAIERLAAVKAHLRPGQPAQPGRAGRPGAAGRRPAGAAGPADADRGSASPTPHDGGDLSTAVHRCTGVGKCRADTTGSGRGDVPVVPGHAGREGLHPRPGPRPAGAGERHAGQAASGSAEVARGAGPVPVLQGLLVGLPGRGGHGHLQGRGAVPAVPPPAAPARPLRAGLAAPLGPAGRPRAGAGQRRPAPAGAGRGGQAAGRHRPPPPAAAVRPAQLPRLVRRSRRPRRPPRQRPRRCCCGWTRSPTTSRPRSAGPPSGCWRRPATRSRSPDSPCAAG